MSVMTPGRKLAVAALVVVGVTGAMAFVGAAASWQYYVTPQECLAGGARFAGHRIRVSGKIVPGSLHIAADRHEAGFLLAGSGGNLPVTCSAAVPDNLAESMDVVVEGRLEAATLLRGDKIITRCASKYKAQAVAAAAPAVSAARAEKTP